MRTILWVQVLSSPETEVHPLLETTSCVLGRILDAVD